MSLPVIPQLPQISPAATAEESQSPSLSDYIKAAGAAAAAATGNFPTAEAMAPAALKPAFADLPVRLVTGLLGFLLIAGAIFAPHAKEAVKTAAKAAVL
jgi:hypothetical protein